MTPADGKIEPVADENGKQPTHRVRFTTGNWIALIGLAIVAAGLVAGWLGRYQTKEAAGYAAKNAALEQQLIDQAQGTVIGANTKAIVVLQEAMQVQSALIANITVNTQRTLATLRDGEDRWPEPATGAAKAKLDELLAAPPGDGP